MKILITLSLIVNLLLAGWWFKHASAGPVVAVTTATVTNRSAAAPATPTISRLPQFAGENWSDIQTDDLRELIKRLRAAGCPEETVQDIVLADVNRRFAIRAQKFLPADLVNRPYWTVDKPDAAAQKDKRARWKNYQKENRTLQEEKSNLLVKLLGVDPEKERLAAEGLPTTPQDWAMEQVAFLPEAKQAAAAKFLDECDDKLQDFYARTGGNWDAGARAEQHKLEEEKLRGLAQILSPAEVREYELRLSQTGQQLITELHGVVLTRGEYEALFDIRKKYGDSVIVWSDTANDPQIRGQIEDNQRAMKSDMAFALGAEKSIEVQQANDPVYQQLASYVKHYQLLPGTTAKVYDLKLTTEGRAQQIKADGGLEPGERDTALQKLRAETEASIKAAFGAQAFDRYVNRDGWWLQNLSANK